MTKIEIRIKREDELEKYSEREETDGGDSNRLNSAKICVICGRFSSREVEQRDYRGQKALELLAISS